MKAGAIMCDFKGCHRPVESTNGTKRTCVVHKYRRHCAIPMCTNQVYARKLCARHGGKRTCKMDRCCAPTTGRGGYCAQHNAQLARRNQEPEELWSPLEFRPCDSPVLLEISEDILSLILELDAPYSP